MQDAKSWRSWRLLIALFVLVELERATTRVIWDRVQPPALSPVAAPAASETAAIDTASDLHGRGSPWPVSTVEVILEVLLGMFRSSHALTWTTSTHLLCYKPDCQGILTRIHRRHTNY